MKYQWKAQPLAQELRNESLPEAEKFKYFLFWVFAFVSMNILFPEPAQPTWVDYLNWIISLSLTLLGVSLCFRTNAAGDNKNFIERLLCLGIPILLQLSVPMLAVTLLFSENKLLNGALDGAFILIFMFRLNHFMKFVSQAEQHSSISIT